MRAVVVGRFGGPEVLTLTTLPDPEAGTGKLVVRVRAANVNPTDLAARMGFMVGGTIDPPFVLGWDLAGTVEAVGEGVDGLAVGDRVVGMIPWYAIGGAAGAYAELAAVDAAWVVPLPEGIEDAAAATIPLNALTARQGLELLDAAPATPVLVTGASGAVGAFAAQMAVAAGHEVTAMASKSDEEWVSALGVAHVLHRDADLSAVGPFGRVFDAVPLGEPVLAAVSDGASIVTTRPTPPADPARRLRQEVFLVRSDRPALAQLVADVAAGRLRTRVARTLPLEDAAEAHRLVEQGGLRGKVVLVP